MRLVWDWASLIGAIAAGVYLARVAAHFTFGG